MKAHLMPALALLTIAACNPAEDSGNLTEISTACAESPKGSLNPVTAWVRPAPEGRAMSAAYVTLCNQTGEVRTLIGVETAAADAAELHETTRDRDGVASMGPIDKIEIAAGATAELKPGGAHIMLIGVEDPIAPGDMVSLTLTFENAEPIIIEAEARDAAGARHGEHEGH